MLPRKFSSTESTLALIFHRFVITQSHWDVAHVEGDNLFDHVAIAHNDPRSIREQKRALPRSINTCPTTTDEFLTSYCTRNTIRSYAVECSRMYRSERGPRAGIVPSSGSCEEDEICMETKMASDIGWGIRSFDQARCVLLTNYARFIGLKNDLAEQGHISAIGSASGLSNRVVQAVLSELDGNTALNATELSIAAQGKHRVYNVELWGTLPGGWKQCRHCASIGLDRVPKGAKRIAVSALLPDSVPGGEIYLGEIAL